MRSPAIVMSLACLLGGLTACGSGAAPSSNASPTPAVTSAAPATPTSPVPPSPSDPTAMRRIDVDGATALTWGSGAYGVVLAHGASYDAVSWRPQAEAIAAAGTTVVAVEDISPDGIRAAVRMLRRVGIERVALVGASAGADAVLDVASSDPTLPDQLVLLSPNAVVQGLGDEPKLFVASRDERVADVSTRLAASAPGDDNEVSILPGRAHAQRIFRTARGPAVLAAIIERLQRFGAAG